MQPMVSILIPVYNSSRFLPACLDSVLNQTYATFELILVDDGSTDNSISICSSFAKKDPRIHVYTQQNRGVAATRNTALSKAVGDYIMFVDSDDTIQSNCLEVLMNLLLHSDASFVCCNHTIDQHGISKPRFLNTSRVTLTQAEAIESILYHGIPDVSCWGKLYKRSLFDNLLYPEGKLYEDTWMIAQLLQRSTKIAYTGETLYHYRIRPDSISRSEWGPQKLDLLEAVGHLISVVRQNYPQLQKACMRRYTHAYMSLRRYFINASSTKMIEQRDEIDKMILQNASVILFDSMAPIRDKIAILACKCGPKVYDTLWKLSGGTWK